VMHINLLSVGTTPCVLVNFYIRIFIHIFAEQYGGKYVVNPSGGLEAKGHPLGATGLGMHFYIMSKVLQFNASSSSITLLLHKCN
jgi:hypothetical protein